MILQALNQLAEDERLVGDPDFEWRPISWLIRVGDGGKLIGIEDTRQELAPPRGKGRPRKVAKRFMVPKLLPGKSGTRPPADFLVGNALYVFGLSLGGRYDTHVTSQRSESFRVCVRKCAEATDDSGAKAVLDFLESLAREELEVKLNEETKSNDLFAFVYAPDHDRLVTQRPAVRDYWKALRAATAAPRGQRVHCLVTGRPCTPVNKHPKIKRVPQKGSSGDLALIPLGSPSNNFESYGWKKNANAPVSRVASEACATAMNRLLDNAPRDADGNALPARNIRLSSNTAVCFWGRSARGGELADALAGLLEANPERVANLYRSVWRGRKVESDDPSAFYALTISGAQGRATVRDWIESTVSEVAGHLAEHFEDLAIVRAAPPPKSGVHPPQLPLRLLLQSTAVLGKDDNIPAPLAAAFIKAALQGTQYPLSILARAVGRSRAEFGQDYKDELEKWKALQRRDARAALCKAVLNRQRRFRIDTQTRYPEIKRTMDPLNDNPGYRLGALMSVLERLQGIALGDINANVVDRYFSGASASPRVAFTRLLKNARHHARKAGAGKDTAMVFLLERLIDELLDTFGQAPGKRATVYPDPRVALIPTSLTLEDQGNFIVGYHHMRKWLWMTSEERDAWEAENPDAPRAFLWRKKSTPETAVVTE